MKRDLEIDLLRSFVAVSARQNFTAAGRVVGRSQSAVSLQIKRLEDIVGKRLFERTRQTVTPTSAGEALLVYANRILSANDAALSHLSRPEAEGLVRIGAPDDYATYLLPPILSAIAREHPRLTLEVTCDNANMLLPLLNTEQIDIVVATHASNAVAGEVARYEPLHWVASPDYADDPSAPLSLVLFPTGCVCRDIALRALKEMDRPWNITYSTRSIGLMEKVLGEGAGVSVMEASVIPDGLRILDGAQGFPALGDVAIAIHRARNDAGPISLVADHVLSKLASSPIQKSA